MTSDRPAEKLAETDVVKMEDGGRGGEEEEREGVRGVIWRGRVKVEPVLKGGVSRIVTGESGEGGGGGETGEGVAGLGGGGGRGGAGAGAAERETGVEVGGSPRVGAWATRGKTGARGEGKEETRVAEWGKEGG